MEEIQVQDENVIFLAKKLIFNLFSISSCQHSQADLVVSVTFLLLIAVVLEPLPSFQNYVSFRPLDYQGTSFFGVLRPLGNFALQ